MAITFGKSSPDDSSDESFRDEEKDDIVIEPEHDEDIEEGKPEQKVAKMREELSACRKEKQEYMDGWQRAKADYVNALKRFGEDAKASESRGKIKAVEVLLPAFDALERAKEHVPSVALAKEGGEVINGFLAVAKQLETAFASLGLEEVGKVGEKFDPALHEAFAQDATENAETDDTITAVLEKGWRVSSTGLGTGNSTVIRPAKVRVAHFG
jgi:molecular chaperone GrpE